MAESVFFPLDFYAILLVPIVTHERRLHVSYCRHSPKETNRTSIQQLSIYLSIYLSAYLLTYMYRVDYILVN